MFYGNYLTQTIPPEFDIFSQVSLIPFQFALPSESFHSVVFSIVYISKWFIVESCVFEVQKLSNQLVWGLKQV